LHLLKVDQEHTEEHMEEHMEEHAELYAQLNVATTRRRLLLTTLQTQEEASLVLDVQLDFNQTIPS
jgi:hypothetical protein